MVALCIGMLILASCQDRRTYSHYAAVDVDGWDCHDTLVYAIPPQHASSYELQLELRTTTAYPFTHLSMLMEQVRYRKSNTAAAPKKDPWRIVKAQCDTVRCQITDAKGTPLGKNGISSTEITYRITSMTLQDGDSVVIRIRHCMERNPIEGISDIGMELLTANP